MHLGLALLISSGRDILIVTVFLVLFGNFSFSLFYYPKTLKP
jgi:hypothetical protein